jgi:dUTP pyrophosphatase
MNTNKSRETNVNTYRFKIHPSIIIIAKREEANFSLSKGSALASGVDIPAHVGSQPTKIYPNKSQIIPTGLFLEIGDPSIEAQVRSRSGLSANRQVVVLNSPGTIDTDYRGEIQVILFNHGERTFTVNNGDRIAQLVFCPIIQADLEGLHTDRGQKGFGSTGY